MNILIIGGMHGNEPLGLEVVALLNKKPLDNVDTVLANKPAIVANSRFTRQDLNRSFPGDIASKEPEPRRAAQLLQLTRKYDVVLDFHNTYCPDNDCGFVGEGASQNLYGIACLLGLDKIIVADYECINKYAANCLSVEISLDSSCNSADIWYKRIKTLGTLNKLSVKPSFEKYRFVYRLTLEDRDTLKLNQQGLRAFQPIKKTIADSLGIASPAFPIFIDDAYTPYNYGGLLNKID